MLTDGQMLIMIGMVALGTVIPRFLPFLLFSRDKESHPFIVHLGNVLPFAMVGFLVVYCLKGVSLGEYPYGIPELLAVAVVGVLHWWKGNALLSIGIGTVLYMILVQAVFV